MHTTPKILPKTQNFFMLEAGYTQNDNDNYKTMMTIKSNIAYDNEGDHEICLCCNSHNRH